MTKPWPPPPDLTSLKELFATADIEGLIADDCPLDEYDPEAKHFYEETLGYPTGKFTAAQLQPLLEKLWIRQFVLDEAQLTQRRPALEALAQQIAHFFGPEAQPSTRRSEPA
ncbi:MAG: hypothetical protein M3Y50_07875 [Acidobacteriota bacterium]|nr:hypothetical protein [Acidobacteriota bacterium]